jgi:hypothetical protein
VKINWFSPLAPTTAGVAEFSVSVGKVFAENHEFCVWTTDNSDPINDYGTPVRPWQPERSWRELADSVCVYNIGNDPHLYGNIFEIARRRPGIVILHNTNLQDLAINRLVITGGDRQTYINWMRRSYGLAGEMAAYDVLDRRISTCEIGDQFPLFEVLLDSAIGTIVHSRNTFNLIKRMGTFPVLCAGLPYQPSGLAMKSLANRREMNKFSNPIRLVAFGETGLNSRLEEFLCAWASHPQARRFQMDVCSESTDEAEWKTLASSLGLNTSIRFHGDLAQDKLEGYLARADISINLCQSTMQDASRDQLIAYSHGLPSMVPNDGWFSELPPDTVFTTNRETEHEDYQRFLSLACESPETFITLGLDGSEYLLQKHTTRHYVEAFVAFSECLAEASLRPTALKLAERVGNTISPWLDTDSRDICWTRIHQAIGELFGVDAPSN